MKLKFTEIKEFREKQLAVQNQKCMLCQEEIDPTEAVLDHNHKNGAIRGVLHRGCNAFLGKIENSLQRNRISPTRLTSILKTAQKYIDSDLMTLHPTYKTAEEKKARIAKKRRKK